MTRGAEITLHDKAGETVRAVLQKMGGGNYVVSESADPRLRGRPVKASSLKEGGTLLVLHITGQWMPMGFTVQQIEAMS